MDRKEGILQEEFASGSVPKNLTGFYKGSLELLLPEGFSQSIARIITKFWIPWYGKSFDQKNDGGDNVLPTILRLFLILRYGKQSILSKDNRGLHVFPFRTRVRKGLQDTIKVLELDYDLPDNPTGVRSVVDELVATGEHSYLGKAYLKKDQGIRLVAYFRLKK